MTPEADKPIEFCRNPDSVASRTNSRLFHNLVEATAQKAPNVLLLALIAVIFAGLDAAFMFAGPLQDYTQATFSVFLCAGAVLLAVLGSLTRFRFLYTGFQDEAVVILAGVIGALGVSAGHSVDDSVYATALAVIAISTFVSSLLFLLLGGMRLGRIIRYVPFSVTAGFMITIGSLLMLGAVELAESRSISNIASTAVHAGLFPFKALASLGVAVMLISMAARFGYVYALPLAVLLALCLFYLVTTVVDLSVAELAKLHWLLPRSGSAPDENGWAILLRAEIDWQVVAAQWRAYVSIAMISALSLLLAVTSLELATRQRVDVDQELRAAGIANACAGLLGGSTGYHEDAVTSILHKHTSGDKTSVVAAAVLCAAVAAFDVSWFSLIPMPVFGGLLLWLGWQLWREWLFHNAKYLHKSDWIAVLAIVGVTLYAGFVAGVMFGVAVGIALFLVDYSQVRTVRYSVSGREIRSNVDRSAAAEQLLYDQGRRIHVIKLQGYLFFARAHQVVLQLEPIFTRISPETKHFALIDFDGVAGIDSTATMAFVRLKQVATDVGAELVFTSLSLEARVDLARVELADGFIKYFENLDAGLAYCEDTLLGERADLATQQVSSLQAFEEILSVSRRSSDDTEAYLKKIQAKKGDLILEAGQSGDGIYLVESGSLSVQIMGIDKKPFAVRGLEPGSVFGEMALYLGGARTASVVANTDAVVLQLDQSSLQRLETDNPQAALVIHRMLARLLATKLRQTNTWLSHLR